MYDITTYTWTYETQLAEIQQPDDTVTTNLYAPVNKSSDELRISKETEAGLIQYIWDNQNIIRELDDTGLVEAEYTLNPQPYGDLVSQSRDDESSFYLFDALGSTESLTDETGTQTDSYIYQPFGQILSQAGTTDNPFTWVGELGYYLDSSANLYQLRWRNFDPQNAIVLTEDPIYCSRTDGNLYSYAINNPTTIVDPSGQSPESVAGEDYTCKFMSPLPAMAPPPNVPKQQCIPLTTTRLRILARNNGGCQGSGILFNRCVGVAFQQSLLSMLGYPENFRRFASPARAAATANRRQSVQPDAVTGVLYVMLIQYAIPIYYADGAFVEIKAVKCSITLGYSTHQATGFLDVLGRSQAARLGGKSASPAMVYVTTSDISIGGKLILRALQRGICLIHAKVCELVPPSKNGQNLQIMIPAVLAAHCARGKGGIIVPRFLPKGTLRGDPDSCDLRVDPKSVDG